MRWAVKVVTAADNVAWEFETTLTRARQFATSRRAEALPEGTRVSVHRCFNDESDNTRRPCEMADEWERSGGSWVKVV